MDEHSLRHNDLLRHCHHNRMAATAGSAKLLRRTASPDELAVYARRANGRSKLAVWKEQARAAGLVSEEALRTKMEYIHKIPVSRKLVDDPAQWLWSSWRSYYLNDDTLLRVDRVEML